MQLPNSSESPKKSGDPDPISIPLVVDLDGTLTPSDTLWESLLWLLKKSPIKLLYLLPKLRLGKPQFKRELLGAINPQEVIETIPWNKAIIKYLEQEKSIGRTIILATASDIELAKHVKNKFTFIDDVMGSTPAHNLKGENKSKDLIKRFGEGQFDYIGNDKSDIAVWNVANKSLIAASLLSPLIKNKLNPNKPAPVIFTLKEKRRKIILRALRIKQWSKNLLVFAPMIASHAYFDPTKWWLGILTFLSFSLCASGAYMLNDLLDVQHDRRHHKKNTRPIAQGYFPIPLAWFLSLFLPLVGLALATYLGVGIYLLVYLTSTILYSVWLKQVAIVDIACLAGLYCLRIITGGVSTSEPVSFWMAVFGGFLFVSLACIKRQAELLNLVDGALNKLSKNTSEAHGRDYNIQDIALTRSIGVATGCIAPLVLALYLEDNSKEQFYTHPEFLWGACGLIFVWIMSLWRETEQMKLKDEDPISYSITNPKSLVLLLLLGITLTLATYAP